jgi:Patatin-like phospholipase
MAAAPPDAESRDVGLREQVPARERWRASPLSGGEAERLRLRRRYLLTGYRPEPLPSHAEPVEPPAPKRVGICCSGGGIRSAAFNLGALQQLQKENVLEDASYLAAVSGGSYIAAAFAMVRKAKADGAEDNSDASLVPEQPPFHPGSPEEQYLRNRSDYLAPDGMAKLYLGYRVVLGLLFNVAFLALPLFGAAMVLGATVYWRAFPSLVAHLCHGSKAPAGCERGLLPTWSWAAPAAMLALSVLLGLMLMVRAFRGETVRRTLQVWSTRLLIGSLLLALLTVALPELVSLLRPHAKTSASSAHAGSILAPASAGGVAALLAALTAQLRSMLGEVEAGAKRFKALSPKLQRAFAYGVAAVVGPLLFYAVIVLSMSLTLAEAKKPAHREHLVAAGVGGVVLFALLYLTVDISALSLHHFYKRRLCSAFALKRVRPRPAKDGPPKEHADQPGHPRIGADAQEYERGIAMERSYKELTLLSQTAIDEPDWPTLLVCAAANISDPGATPPGRHVTSFTFSPHTVGGPLVGAMATHAYEGEFDDYHNRQRDLTLPAAVAMSGAAVSPSMGKLTKRPLTFLLALGNVRLGVWVPNPRWVDSGASWIGAWRPPRPSYLLRELFGRNRIDGRYLYVTDGGHYENLGLVELLRRGCTEIYCFDASGGESFSELGDAVALARSELGVEIVIDPTPLIPTPQSTSGEETIKEPDVSADIAVKGSFRYRDGTEGVLYYARNVMTGSAPWDVRARHIEDPTFPHDPTTDQLYTDQKFESYRALGERAGARALQLAGAI